MQKKFETLSNSFAECMFSHFQAPSTSPSLLVGSLCSVNVWQLADNGIKDLIFICTLEKLRALDFALSLHQIQQSYSHLPSSNKEVKLMKLMVPGYSFSPKEFEGSAQVLMALEGKPWKHLCPD